MSDHPVIRWTEAGLARSARWRSEKGIPPPKRLVIADEQMSADAAYRLACEGTALLWRGDFQNARQMLLAMARRADEKTRKARKSPAATKPRNSRELAIDAATAIRSAAQPATDALPATTLPTEAFHLHRLAQSQRARTLGMLLLPLAGDYTVPLRRAPELQRACVEAYGPPGADAAAGDSVVSMRELLGLIGAHEWRKKGVEVPALGDRIHPHYGVFAPVRGEYVGLVAEAPLPIPDSSLAAATPLPLAFDIGTGTGVLAAVLARRGVARVVATDTDPRALACASENLRRLKLAPEVQLVLADLFPVICVPGAGLLDDVVCDTQLDDLAVARNALAL